MGSNIQDRIISLGEGLASIPERLLLAHARGEVLFICGAGVSKPMPADLPDFRKLVLDVYAKLDAGVRAVLSKSSAVLNSDFETHTATLTHIQKAEIKRFMDRDYDVVLGMLERRLDGKTQGDSSVRRAVSNRLRAGHSRPLLCIRH